MSTNMWAIDFNWSDNDEIMMKTNDDVHWAIMSKEEFQKVKVG